MIFMKERIADLEVVSTLGRGWIQRGRAADRSSHSGRTVWIPSSTEHGIGAGMTAHKEGVPMATSLHRRHIEETVRAGDFRR